LYFKDNTSGSNIGVAVVDADTVSLGSDMNTTVPVEPLEVALPSNGDTTVVRNFGFYRLLAPINIPTSANSSKVNRTDLTYGLQGSQVKVKNEFSIQIQTHNRKDDKALWQVIFPASQASSVIYAMIVHPDGQLLYGTAIVSDWTKDNNIEEISRPQFTLDFQAPFSYTPPRSQITSAEQLQRYTRMIELAGLPDTTGLTSGALY
jgi:hypothetical protein